MKAIETFIKFSSWIVCLEQSGDHLVKTIVEVYFRIRSELMKRTTLYMIFYIIRSFYIISELSSSTLMAAQMHVYLTKLVLNKNAFPMPKFRAWLQSSVQHICHVNRAFIQ